MMHVLSMLPEDDGIVTGATDHSPERPADAPIEGDRGRLQECDLHVGAVKRQQQRDWIRGRGCRPMADGAECKCMMMNMHHTAMPTY